MIVDSSQKEAEEVQVFRKGKKFDNHEISQLSEKPSHQPYTHTSQKRKRAGYRDKSEILGTPKMTQIVCKKQSKTFSA